MKKGFSIFNEKKKWWKPFPANKEVLSIIKKTIENNHITFGKNCINLEKKLARILKVNHVILTTSGTSALYMATLALDIENNRKIFSPIMTWAGSINPILFSKKKNKLY